jgi:hypothetical protein
MATSTEKFKLWANPNVYLNFGGFDKFERKGYNAHSSDWEKKPRAVLQTEDMSTAHPQEDKFVTAKDYTLAREQYRDPALPYIGIRPRRSKPEKVFKTYFEDSLCTDTMQYHVQHARENGTITRPIENARQRMAKRRPKTAPDAHDYGEWEWTEPNHTVGCQNSRILTSAGQQKMVSKARGVDLNHQTFKSSVEFLPLARSAGAGVDFRNEKVTQCLTRQFRWTPKRAEINHLFMNSPLPGGSDLRPTTSESFKRRQQAKPLLVSHPSEVAYNAIDAKEYHVITITLLNPAVKGTMCRWRIPPSSLVVSRPLPLEAGSAVVEAFPPAGRMAAGTRKKIDIRIRGNASGTVEGVIQVFTEVGDFELKVTACINPPAGVNENARLKDTTEWAQNSSMDTDKLLATGTTLAGTNASGFSSTNRSNFSNTNKSLASTRSAPESMEASTEDMRQTI